MTPAPRHIPATIDDLAGWCGPAEFLSVRGWSPCVVAHESGRLHIYALFFERETGTDDPVVRLDPARYETRDHLIRRYNLPEWHRDTPGGLTAEVSAGLVLGSVLRVRAGLCPLRSLLPMDIGNYAAPVVAGEPAYVTVHRVSRYTWYVSGLSNGAYGACDTPDDVVTSARMAALRGPVAVVVPEGILLPPLTPGGDPVLWTTP